MKIKLLVDLRGATITANKGEEIIVDDIFGGQLITANAAELVDTPVEIIAEPEPESEPEEAETDIEPEPEPEEAETDIEPEPEPKQKKRR